MRLSVSGSALPLLVATLVAVVYLSDAETKYGPRKARSKRVYKRNDLDTEYGGAKGRNAGLASRKRQRGYRLTDGKEWTSWQPYSGPAANRVSVKTDSGRSDSVYTSAKSRPYRRTGGKTASYNIRPEDRLNARKKGKKAKNEKPNIVVILTDDQDSELGSLKVMKKTLGWMQEGGVTFKNSFVSTPMCCPSRSSFLTGMYVHNHNVYTNNDNCSSPMWREQFEPKNFGAYLSNQAGYRTGYFGKYLNEYDGKHIPPGWREWVGLIRNSRFYNYSVNFNGRIIRHGFDYHKDYFTDLIANDSVTFLRQSKQSFPHKPIAMVLSVPAPHGPEDAAPQYQHMFKNNTSHHTVSWNHAPNPDHQWILAHTGKMEPIHIAFTDMLHQKRLQTLMSVDDLVNKVFTELRRLGELDNTYVIYTSDHGYHLGQFGLVKGKAMPYDFDVRVPLLVRGPGLQKGVTIENLVQNVDIAPTVLDLAGVAVPPDMDGRSFLPLLDLARDRNNIYGGRVKKKKAWRDTVLLERGKLTRKNVKTREKLEQKQQNRITKEQAMVDKCKQAEYASPCRPGQKWECRENERGRLRMYKCRLHALCRCADGRYGRKPTDNLTRPRRLRKRQNRGRWRRSVDDYDDEKEDNELDEGSGEVDNDLGEDTPYSGSGVARRCRVLNNDTVVCDEEVYNSVFHWKRQKAQVNKIIQDYRQKLEELRGMRRHLRNKKPNKPLTTYAVTPFETSTWEPPAPTTTLTPTTTPTQPQTTTTSTATTTTTATTPTTTTTTHRPLNPYEDQVLYDAECVCDTPTRAAPTEAPEMPEEVEESAEMEAADYDEESSQRMSIRLRKLNKRYKENPTPKLRQKIDLIARRLKKMKKRARRRMKGDVFMRKCNSSKMKCFVHDNDHWKTKPVWTSPRRDPACTIKGVECHRMDNQHWKTEPKWTLGPFCFCPNSANNTYWCLRTINDTHNFLFCEFITGFVSYYDMTVDPWQLRNAIRDLPISTLHDLQDRLAKMRRCKGSRECTHRTRGGMEVRPVPTKDPNRKNDLLEGSGDGDEGSGQLTEDNDHPSTSGRSITTNRPITGSKTITKQPINGLETTVLEFGSGEGSGDEAFLHVKEGARVNTDFSYLQEQTDIIQ